MKIRAPRMHSISVRLSEEEFTELKLISLSRRSRSISDLIREMLYGKGLNGGTLTPQTTEYVEQLKIVEQKVEQLSAEMQLLKEKCNKLEKMIGLEERHAD